MTKATPRLRINCGEKFPVEVSGPSELERALNLATWKAALKEVGGNARRLRRETDGSITILGEPRRIFLVRLCVLTGTYRFPQKEIPRFREIRPPRRCFLLLVDVGSR